MFNRMKSATGVLRLVCLGALAFGGSVACSSGDSDPNPSGTGGTNSGGTTASGGTTGNTGGTSGSGGSDSGGGGTTSQPTSVCDEPGRTLVRSSGMELISDLEDEMTLGWYVYQSTVDDAGTVTAEGEIVEDGANEESTYSIRYAGSGWPTYGAGMGFGLGCTDTSAFTGICFWAKGTTSESEAPSPPKDANVLNFQVAIPETHAKNIQDGENIGGDCEPDSGRCYGHPAKDITISEEWEEFCIPFSELSAASNGVIASYDGIIMALGWHSLGGDFDYQIDDVRLYAE